MATVVNKQTLEVLESVNTPEYDPSEWLINPSIPDAPKRHWKVSGDSLVLKNASEINSADAEYLTLIKEDRKRVFKDHLGDGLQSKYSTDEKLSLLLILQLAIASGNTARVNYLNQLSSWIDQGQQLLYAAQDNIDSATSVDEVESMELNLDAWLGADPQVVIRTAKGIE